LVKNAIASSLVTSIVYHTDFGEWHSKSIFIDGVGTAEGDFSFAADVIDRIAPASS
jgi:hypothetical protein